MSELLPSLAFYTFLRPTDRIGGGERLNQGHCGLFFFFTVFNLLLLLFVFAFVRFELEKCSALFFCIVTCSSSLISHTGEKEKKCPH